MLHSNHKRKERYGGRGEKEEEIEEEEKEN